VDSHRKFGVWGSRVDSHRTAECVLKDALGGEGHTTESLDDRPVSLALSAVRMHACSHKSTQTAVAPGQAFRREREMTPEPGPTSRNVGGGEGCACPRREGGVRESRNSERRTEEDLEFPEPNAQSPIPCTPNSRIQPLHHAISTLRPHPDLDYAVDKLFGLWPRYQRRRPHYDVIQVVKVPLANDVLDRGTRKSLGNVAANSDGSIQIREHPDAKWGKETPDCFANNLQIWYGVARGQFTTKVIYQSCAATPKCRDRNNHQTGNATAMRHSCTCRAPGG